jgi:hypothetical protein
MARRRISRDGVDDAVGALREHMGEAMSPEDCAEGDRLLLELLRSLGQGGEEDEGEGERRDPALTSAQDLRAPRMGLDRALSGGPVRSQRRGSAVSKMLGGYTTPRNAGSIR